MPRVLIVEGDSVSAGLAEAVLRCRDYEVRVVFDGAAAVEVARRERPDLVLMDMRVPVIEGDEACRMIKAQAAPAHVPVVIVSAERLPEDRERGLWVGVDGYVVRPYKPECLVQLLNALMEQRWDQEPSAAPPDYPTDSRARSHRPGFYTITGQLQPAQG